MFLKGVTLREVRGDVAEVEVDAGFQTFPRWANIVAILTFVLIRILGVIVALALYFGLRKRARVTFRKRMIRGTDGLWYVLDPRLFEEPPRVV